VASVFGHIMASTAIGLAFFPQAAKSRTLLIVAAASACLPDADVLGLRFGIPYASQWGHRGWTHSIVFAVVWGLLISWLFARKRKDYSRIAMFMILSTLSHPLLDMLTNGGRGVALWWPLDTRRIFFPWHPIQVSPLTMSDFFSPWGLEVLASEIWYIGLPSMVLIMAARGVRQLNQDKKEQNML
jgi:inner membrane protein